MLPSKYVIQHQHKSPHPPIDSLSPRPSHHLWTLNTERVFFCSPKLVQSGLLTSKTPIPTHNTFVHICERHFCHCEGRATSAYGNWNCADFQILVSRHFSFFLRSRRSIIMVLLPRLYLVPDYINCGLCMKRECHTPPQPPLVYLCARFVIFWKIVRQPRV